MSMPTFDYEKQQTNLQKAALDSIRDVFPVIGGSKVLELKRVWVDDTKEPSIRDEKKAMLEKGTVGDAIYGELEMTDKDGKVLSKKKMKLATLPRTLARTGSFLVRGNHYQVSNQLRLRSGAYTVEKENGELKSFFNLKKGGHGRSLSAEMNPTTGVFKMKIDQGSVELYPVLKAMGVTDSKMRAAWGDEVWAANRDKSSKKMETVAKRAALSLTGKKPKDVEAAGDALRGFFDSAPLDPEVSLVTLGKPHATLSPDVLVASSRELLLTHRKERQPDDKDSLLFKSVHSVEDFLPEMMGKSGKAIGRRLKTRLDMKKNTKVGDVLAPATFAKPLEAAFTRTALSATTDQTNPIDMLSAQHGVTVMGEGGIQSEHAITTTTRSLHPSHLGFIDPVHTPESSMVGVSLHLPIGVTKDGNALKTQVLDAKSKKRTTLDNGKFWNATVAFADQWDPKKKKFKGRKVKVVRAGEVMEVAPKDVDYVLPSSKAVFGWAANMVPFFQSDNGNRVLMAANMMTQAVPLRDREAPRVQAKTGSKQTFEDLVGGGFSFRAPVAGEIVRVNKDNLTIKDSKGDIHKVDFWENFPLNGKAFLHADVKVKAGDVVKEDQLLADSNFTDDGTLALGTNLKTAFIPYDGYNYEDGIVITEGAAEKLTSQHMHRKSAKANDPKVIIDKKRFRAEFRELLTSDNAEKLGDNGVVRVGQKVAPGDILIAAMREKGMDAENLTWGKLSRMLVRPYSSREAVTWDKDVEGVVTDVSRDKRGDVTVYVKTEERAQVGDKLAGRHGNKGIIVKIIPDAEAPHTADGEPAEILLNPHGVPSRINIGQMYETAVGKGATPHKPYVVNNFDLADQKKAVVAHLKTKGLSDQEELTDPRTGQLMRFTDPKTGATRDPLVGSQYYLKLFKQAGSNFSARYRGSYDIDERPVRGSGERAGAKQMDMLSFYAMLSHNARDNLKEMASYKSTKNDDFWRAIETGRLPPPPRPTFAFNKLLEMIRATGVQVEKKGSELELRPMLDDEVRSQSSGVIKEPQFYRAKDLLEHPNGLMSRKLTGGMSNKGTKWTHYELSEEIPNPMFEDAVKRITGITKGQFAAVVSGQKGVDENGKVGDDGTKGGAGIRRLLEGVNVESEIRKVRRKIPKARKSELDNLNKKLRTLEALRRHKQTPAEAYMMKTVPIIPPMFRPIYPLPDGNLRVSPVNFLYRDVGLVNQKLGADIMDMLEDEDEEKIELRRDLYQGVAALQGLGSPIKFYNQKVEGFLQAIKGEQNKVGFFQSKVLSRTQDLTGRGTIVPEPNLGVDQVGLPEKMAWTLFQPFVMEALQRSGRTPGQSKTEIEEQSPIARRALDTVMAARLVHLNRAPSLHKFSVMAFQPVVVPGKAIRIPPLVVKGFNADFDGDAMSVHVPVMDAALKEARGMVPSKHLLNPRDNGIMLTPGQESLTGLHLLSDTKAGRAKINAILPDKFDIGKQLDDDGFQALMHRLVKDHADDYGKVIDQLKRLGDSYATAVGFTVNLDDLDSEFGQKEGKEILAQASRDAAKKKTPAAKAKVFKAADLKLQGVLKKKHAGGNNGFFRMMQSGGKGSWANSKQIMGVPGVFDDAAGNAIPVPVTHNFAHGLPLSEYWTSLYGARKGSIDRSRQTSIPGSDSKSLMAASVASVVSEEDCGTSEGRHMPSDDTDVYDRFLARDQGSYKRNTLVSPDICAAMQKAGIKTVEVRSPLRCRAARGICSMCFGLRETGNRAEIGENVGAMSGQALGEPMTQMIMNTKHTGGASGTGLSLAASGGYATIKTMLKMPKIQAGKATLSDESGKVERVEESAVGGYDVWIRGKKHHAGKNNPLKVKVGDKVERGDQLSEGLIQPAELLERKGLRATQDYITDSLSDAYSGQGKPVKKRLIETVVRGITNLTRVLEPGDSRFVPGDLVPWSEVERHNEKRRHRGPLDSAAGRFLAKDYGHLLAGTEVDRGIISRLRQLGHREVESEEKPVVHEPLLKGIEQIPGSRKDWLSQMGYREIVKGLREGAAQGWKSDIRDYSPIPAYAYGATFGGGRKGAY